MCKVAYIITTVTIVYQQIMAHRWIRIFPNDLEGHHITLTYFRVINIFLWNCFLCSHQNVFLVLYCIQNCSRWFIFLPCLNDLIQIMLQRFSRIEVRTLTVWTALFLCVLRVVGSLCHMTWPLLNLESEINIFTSACGMIFYNLEYICPSITASCPGPEAAKVLTVVRLGYGSPARSESWEPALCSFIQNPS